MKESEIQVRSNITSSNVIFEVSFDGNKIGFYCPGCKNNHIVDKNTWNWNGDRVKPTLSPSILITTNDDPNFSRRCHSFIRNGMILFLDDCWHELKGLTVKLTEDR